MPHVVTRAGAVHVSDRGDGPPIVLLHATLHDHHDFDPILEQLAAHFRVLAVDWPGHGESDPLPADMPASAMLFAGVLEDVLNQLHVSRAVFIGNSVGGFAAARLAATQPERVSHLVLVNGGGFTRHNAVTRTFCRMMGTPAVTRMVWQLLIPRYMRARTAHDHTIIGKARTRARTREGVHTTAALWRSFAAPEYNLRPLAAGIVAPALLIWGARDIILPLREGRAAWAAIPGSRLVPLPTGHVPFSSDPDEFLAHTLEFIRRPSDTVGR
ncbi:alpha/beta hydrolase [Nocardia uniformis]|uniref:Alpha/beta hydrolase n=1 Tax=Nocardia uniformis TaxID=53432 RepID=A0A849BZ58_9NOCA|nr:alpha/beta hydrolase [Nocardia uniformis]NNH69530.1 alpha/beta hydrolase [Nocardia uniformis]